MVGDCGAVMHVAARLLICADVHERVAHLLLDLRCRMLARTDCQGGCGAEVRDWYVCVCAHDICALVCVWV